MRRTESEMRPIVEQYNNRTISRKAFCKKFKLNSAVLGYWVNKLRKVDESKPTRPYFAEIEIADPVISALGESKFILIRTNSGLEIKIPV